MLGVVRDDNLGNFKSTNDVLSYEISGVPFSDFSERLGLYLLCEIVDGNDQKLSLQWSLR